MATVQQIRDSVDNTIVDRSAPKPNTVNKERSEAAVNQFGQQLIRGGSVLGAGFFDSIITAYSNAVNSPVALMLMVLGVVGLITEYHSVNGPLERMLAMCNKHIMDAGVLAQFCKFFAKLLTVLIPVKIFVFTTAMFGSVYIAKPSKRNMIIGCVAVPLFTIIDIGAIELVLAAQTVFLESQLRNPTHKLLMWILLIFVFILGSGFITDIYGTIDDKAKEATPQPSLLKKLRTTTPKP